MDNIETITSEAKRESLNMSNALIQKIISGAKKKSRQDLDKLSTIIDRLPQPFLLEAVTLFCKFLDVPVFDPESPLSPSLRGHRDIAFRALICVGNISQSELSVQQSPMHKILEHSWPKIFNWMQYFYCDASSSAKSSNNKFSYSTLAMLVSVLSNCTCDRALFQRVVRQDKHLLALIIKVWIQNGDAPSDPFTTRRLARLFALLYEGVLLVNDARNERRLRANEIHAIFLGAAGGDTGDVTRRIIQHIKKPERTSREYYEIILYAVGVASYLLSGYDENGRETLSMFTEDFLKDDIVPMTIHLLATVRDDLSRPVERQVFPAKMHLWLSVHILIILGYSLRSCNAPHWTAVMLRKGLLRSVAGLCACFSAEGGFLKSVMALLDADLPRLLCLRPVVIAAITAVNDITVDGTVKKIQSSPLKELWKNFEDLLLERTVCNAICNRDLVGAGDLTCMNCYKPQSRTSLFRCAGCRLAVYCSKECQVTSWKSGGHKALCKSMLDVSQISGKATPYNRFLHQLVVQEIARHAPRLVPQFSGDKKNPEGSHFADSSLTISFESNPPVIGVCSGNGLLKSDLIEEDTRGAILKEMENDLGRRNLGEMVAVKSHYYRGGDMISVDTHFIPKYIVESVEGEIYPGDAKIFNLTRVPAKDEEGNDLPFVLTEVDYHVIFARTHFRPRAAGGPGKPDSATPKTIYQFVEKMVANSPQGQFS